MRSVALGARVMSHDLYSFAVLASMARRPGARAEQCAGPVYGRSALPTRLGARMLRHGQGRCWIAWQRGLYSHLARGQNLAVILRRVIAAAGKAFYNSQ